VTAHRLLVASLLLLVVSAACSPPETADPTATTPATEETTATTEPPQVLGVARALDLQVGDCYAPLPEPTVDPDAPATTAPATTTTTMVTKLVADCSGSYQARVFATSCLQAMPDGTLDGGPCPGSPQDPWPGDREVRRAATRICLQHFEQTFGEPYATSVRVTEELTPTEGAWVNGDHRVVCAATEP
jgi:hypothetical protein